MFASNCVRIIHSHLLMFCMWTDNCQSTMGSKGEHRDGQFNAPTTEIQLQGEDKKLESV